MLRSVPKMKISFIIPCYNTNRAIWNVLDEIDAAMKNRVLDLYEIIMVNDCSPDLETLNILMQVVEKRKDVILIDLSKNSGQPNAILAGCRYSTGDYVMTSDDDGQTQIEKLDKFIEKIESGYDVVCANYTSRDQKSLFRKIGSYINNKMAQWLIKRPKGIYMSTVFMSKKYVVDKMLEYEQPYAYISGLILRITQNVGNVEMEQRGRQEGESGYTFGKLLSLWLNGFTAFSIKPLRVADLIGGIVALLGFVLAILTVIKKMLDNNVQVGWSSLISVILITNGIHLILLGIVGEYVGRTYMCINGTPQYVVKKVYRNDIANN